MIQKEERRYHMQTTKTNWRRLRREILRHWQLCCGALECVLQRHDVPYRSGTCALAAGAARYPGQQYHKPERHCWWRNHARPPGYCRTDEILADCDFQFAGYGYLPLHSKILCARCNAGLYQRINTNNANIAAPQGAVVLLFSTIKLSNWCVPWLAQHYSLPRQSRHPQEYLVSVWTYRRCHSSATTTPCGLYLPQNPYTGKKNLETNRRIVYY